MPQPFPIPGNHAKKFLLHAKNVLPALMIETSKGQKVGKVAELLYVVIRVLNTDKKINVKVFKHICHMIGMLVITHFPWARMNETMHSVRSVLITFIVISLLVARFKLS